MATLIDYLKGLASEYGPAAADGAAQAVAERVQRVDAKLRDPQTAKSLVDGVIDGVLGAWRACPHGVSPGEPCLKCKPPKLEGSGE